MKKFFILMLLAVSVFGETVLAHPRRPPGNRDVYGWWRTVRPLVDDPFVVSSAELYIDRDSVYFRTTCAYSNGPVLTPDVEAPISMQNGFFHILQNRFREDRWGRYGCVAQLTAGVVEYQTDISGRMVLFNRATGWRMDFIR